MKDPAQGLLKMKQQVLSSHLLSGCMNEMPCKSSPTVITEERENSDSPRSPRVPHPTSPPHPSPFHLLTTDGLTVGKVPMPDVQPSCFPIDVSGFII